jgi:hypothetical protein
MKWLRTKFIDTYYPDARGGEAHTRGLKQLLGLRSDGELYAANGFADRETPESLRAFLDFFLEAPAVFPVVPEAIDDFKGAAGWVEEPQ